MASSTLTSWFVCIVDLRMWKYCGTLAYNTFVDYIYESTVRYYAITPAKAE